eukprot:15312882-Alexandrium_andersonii.AAC.1
MATEMAWPWGGCSTLGALSRPDLQHPALPMSARKAERLGSSLGGLLLHPPSPPAGRLFCAEDA